LCFARSSASHLRTPAVCHFALPEMFVTFDERKAVTLAALASSSPDRSPKGSLDAPIADLVSWLNEQPDLFTTSSCSGRISLFQSVPGQAKGGRWLLASHARVSPEELFSALDCAEDEQPVTLFFEPFILTAEARTLASALLLLRVAQQSGLRESGICGCATHKVTLTLRSSLRLEAPVSLPAEGRLHSPSALSALLRLANEKFDANAARTLRFASALWLALSAPAEPLPLPAVPRGCTCRSCGAFGHRSLECPTPRKARRPAVAEPSRAALLAARQEVLLFRCAAVAQVQPALPSDGRPSEKTDALLLVPAAEAQRWKDHLDRVGACEKGRAAAALRSRLAASAEAASLPPHAVALPLRPASLAAVRSLLDSTAGGAGCRILLLQLQPATPPPPPRLSDAEEAALLTHPSAGWLRLLLSVNDLPFHLLTHAARLGTHSLGCPRERRRLADVARRSPERRCAVLAAGCGGYALPLALAAAKADLCVVPAGRVRCWERRALAAACVAASVRGMGERERALLELTAGDAREHAEADRSSFDFVLVTLDGPLSSADSRGWLLAAAILLRKSGGAMTVHWAPPGGASDESDAAEALCDVIRHERHAADPALASSAARCVRVSRLTAPEGGLSFDMEVEPRDATPPPAQWPAASPVPRVAAVDRAAFLAAVAPPGRQPRPAVLLSLPGSAGIGKWTAASLAERCGEVCVDAMLSRDACLDLAGHRAAGANRRNWRFVRLPMAEAVSRCASETADEKLYLRSTSQRGRSHVAELFPGLATDVAPLCAVVGTEEYHSSVLRLASGDTHLACHYDTADNVLLQARGAKRVVLFPPADAHALHCEGSAARVDVAACLSHPPEHTAQRWPRAVAALCGRMEVLLAPGEALFIPSHWFHYVCSTQGLSCAVNVFFRPQGLCASQTDARDDFGNREPQAAQRCGLAVAEAQAELRRLPGGLRALYARRAARELLRLAEACEGEL